jgi:murein hydrolase activator
MPKRLAAAAALGLCFCLLVLSISASAATRPAAPRAKSRLIDDLARIRDQIVKMERGLYDELRDERGARASIGKIQQLTKLQHRERELGQLRMLELQNAVRDLEGRRSELQGRLVEEQAAIRGFLVSLERASRGTQSFKIGPGSRPADAEKLEAPRRRILANMVERSLKEVEAYKADLADADNLEREIAEEKRQLALMFQDLDEQETVLEMNRQLQADLLKRREGERFEQVENYRKLRFAESQVEELLKQFNSRTELQRTVEAERDARESMRGAFAHLKGRLALPVDQGRVLTGFGKTFDPQTQLYVFRKGITIEAKGGSPVKAVSGGKIAYAGSLPDYGQVAIIDHGDHYYTLCAHLGELRKRTGDIVMAGDPLGFADEAGTPVYFEIRDRNIAVNPLQWVSN